MPRSARVAPGARTLDVAVAARRSIAPLAAQAIESRGAQVVALQPVEEGGLAGPLVALMASSPARAFGVVDPVGLAPDDARLVAMESARHGKPVVVLSARPVGRTRRSRPESWPLPEDIAWRGFLAGLGLIPAPDLGAWVEALVQLAAAPAPRGGRIAVVFPPALAGLSIDEPPAALSVSVAARPSRHADAVVELPAGNALVDEILRLGDRLRGLAAVARALPPGLPPLSAKEARDRAQFVLDRAGRVPGEHDAKLLLASYGIHVSRQAVVHSASAATRIADRLGYPVDVRAAIGGLAAEEQGAPVVSAVANAPGVRRAYTTVNFDQERLTGQAWEAAVVRERPPHGPRLRVSVFRHGRLGWLAAVAPPPLCGEARPTVAASALPLSQRAAMRFAASPEIAPLFPAGRFGAAATAGLGDVLMRLSRLVLDQEERLEELSIDQLVCTVQRRAIAFEARLVRRW